MPAKTPKRIVEYRNYCLPFHFPVLLLTGEKWMISDVPSGNLHFHNCLEIGFCHSESGSLEFYNGQVVPFSKGDITWIPRNIPHTTYSAPGQRSRWTYLFLEPRLLFKELLPPDFDYSQAQDSVNNYLIHGKDAPRLPFLIRVVTEELSSDSPDYLLARSYLLALYMEILRVQKQPASGSLTEAASPAKPAPVSTAPTGSSPADTGLVNFSPVTKMNVPSIVPALNYIEDNYMNKFPIEQLAELCHLSPTHFRRIFHSVMRMSPLSYLNSVRIMNACNLLRNTNYTILSISEMTGFSTLSNFNRHFSQLMKASPREFRKQLLSASAAEEMPSIVQYAGWMEPGNTPPPGGLSIGVLLGHQKSSLLPAAFFRPVLSYI